MVVLIHHLIDDLSLFLGKPSELRHWVIEVAFDELCLPAGKIDVSRVVELEKELEELV